MFFFDLHNGLVRDKVIERQPLPYALAQLGRADFDQMSVATVEFQPGDLRRGVDRVPGTLKIDKLD